MYFVFDLDGTICFKGQPVTEPILQSLEQLTASGHEVVFASARPIRDLLPVLDKRFHGYKMVGGNGSLICQNGNIKQVAEFSFMILVQLKAILEKYRATYLIDGDWDYAYTGPADHPILNNLNPHNLAEKKPLERLNSIVKVLILTSYNMDALYEELKPLDIIIHLHKDEGVLDISPTGIHKWSALKQLCIPQGSYIAFGNDTNDISMFKHAHHAVMIGHHDMLAPYSDETISNDFNVEQQIIEKIAEFNVRYA
ncbi:HAD family phosphatase [Viridibacillus sp. YIM B01967]|uniref:HAD family phosphatase n=1 Tax=Viridibacillus soli TaxID=2798301 RepID=A0ABS1H9J9_9BACL|nr:HAD family hydrolase [Viridibacillus soli]MBK3495693.1 HAD family phosphatase [Viridibacillus soli]